MKLWVKILIALSVGIITGLIVGPEIAAYAKPIGALFMGLINMLIIPLVFASMTLGITSIHDPQKLGRVGLRTVILYLGSTLAAVVIGLFFGELFRPGEGMSLQPTQSTIQAPIQLQTLFSSLIPMNPIASMAQGNVPQIIIFAVFLGLAINLAGEKGKPLRTCIESMADVMYRLTAMVMKFAPIGVFAIMTWVAGSFGLSVLLPLIKFLFTFYAACAVHVILVFCGMLWIMAKVKPLPFFRGMSDATMMAFTTCSSSAALTTSLRCAQENLGISRNIANFVLPLGSTVNMNGTALFQAMSAVFIAQAYGVTLELQHFAIIIVTATMSAIGTAGTSGAGFIMLSAVISSAGLPIEGVAILAGVDRLREMVATVLNILGDAVCAIYVAKKEGEFDEQRYYSTEPAPITLATSE